MSDKVITKQVRATICDACEKEIVHGSDYCYARLVEQLEYKERSERKGVKHFVFSLAVHKPEYKYITYDFHAECMDKMIQKFIKEKK